ncbi:hypothetical protein [Sphingomonas sp. CCH5-D11]|nr:hypothetical protein [Sphingomonas sp. CCH5-D11]
MANELSAAEAAEIMRHDIVVLLSKDPHHPLAQLIGQALLDLEDE